jgi:Cu/Ag efflux pump CusA
VNRENLKRKIDIGANVSGERDLGSVYRDVETALASIKFPHGFHPELLGEYTESLKAQSKMFYTATISLLVIFILLVTVLGSVKLAIISFLCLPAAMVGGVLAAYFGGGIISLGSMVGFLTILGIAARNGILMIDHFQHLEREEGVEFGPDLVLRGSRERLAPILMTSLCTGVALVPLVLAGQIPGNEIELPMAIVILGGLVTATLLNLFVIPSLYLRFGARRASEKPFAGDPQPAFAQP